MADQYECTHGHAYYDGDRGVGSPFEDGWHDAKGHHGRMDVTSWDPWERHAYEGGFRAGLEDREGIDV